MKELKTCPFCGGKAQFVAEAGCSDSTKIFFHIKCKDCEVTYPKRYKIKMRLSGDGEVVYDVDERQNAADDWNRRSCGDNEG